jgi:Na+/H+ antiporter NhaD/arsenite permease-like protein
LQPVGAGGAGESYIEDAEDVQQYVPMELDQLNGQIGDFSAKTTRRICWAVFLTTIILLITHGASERTLGWLSGVKRHDGTWGLPEGTLMIASALFMGCVVLILHRDKARELVERRVDWWTLSFFMMLFASVGTLEHTGVTKTIAEHLIHGAGEEPFWMINIVGWSTGWLSAFLDNVLAVATFMPVIRAIRISADGPYPEAIYWMMLFGGTFMGNMTIIGSTANIIAIGVLEKRGHGTIPFWYWMKIGFIVSIASMLTATLLLGMQTHWFTTPLLPPPPTAGVSVH